MKRVATSREEQKAPAARKREYIERVTVKRTSHEMKNWEGVRWRLDMKYTTMSKMETWGRLELSSKCELNGHKAAQKASEMARSGYEMASKRTISPQC